jgi:hypothetical protein
MVKLPCPYNEAKKFEASSVKDNPEAQIIFIVRNKLEMK